MKSLIKIILVFFVYSSFSQAAVVGVIDNQIDIYHPSLVNYIWNNPLEKNNSIDDDENGFIDDINGWNFKTSSPVLLDESLRHTAESDIYRYYLIKAKRSYNTMTKKEEEWLEEISKDKAFQDRRSKFKSITHGTHISGIITSKQKTYIPIKIKGIVYIGQTSLGVPDNVPNFQTIAQKNLYFNSTVKSWVDDKMKRLRLAVLYGAQGTQVLNLSFGSSFKKYTNNIEMLYKKVYGKAPSEFLGEKLTRSYIDGLIEGSRLIFSRYPDHLFITSAGNSKLDNDKYPHYPSNARLPNVIAVGASLETRGLANFSNFGERTVDILAPGVGIESLSPNNPNIRINGSSQAAAHVSNIAGNIINIAQLKKRKISAATVKEIILKTGKKMSSLKNKVSSSAIVDAEKAYNYTEGLY